MGTIYLLHFDQAFGHARHYLGWTGRPLEERLNDHRTGNGAALMAAIRRAGIGFSLARVWELTDRNRERSIKNQGGLSRHCPTCRANGTARKLK